MYLGEHFSLVITKVTFFPPLGGEYSEMSNAVAALARSASEMMAQRESERQSSQASSEVSIH